MKRGHSHMDRIEIVDYRSSWDSVCSPSESRGALPPYFQGKVVLTLGSTIIVGQNLNCIFDKYSTINSLLDQTGQIQSAMLATLARAV